MSEIISGADLRKLVDSRIADGAIVAGPTMSESGKLHLAELAESGSLKLDGYIRTSDTIKQYIFPRHEVLYSYSRESGDFELTEPTPFETEQIVIGGRPCDAASLPLLDSIFRWDYEDAFYERRRALTTIVTLACKEWDSHCFCTSVELGPASESGSDVLLFDLGDDTFEVRCLTDKGKALFDGKTQSSDKAAPEVEGPPKDLDIEVVQQFLDADFDSPEWDKITLRCIACGDCAYGCPTCHCFDIVDEPRTSDTGIRARNWDACQFSMFTMHASGHNPRNVQGARQRQRINHKFHIFKEKFGDLLCTGCGNCSRDCPAGLGVRPVLEAIKKMQQATS